MRKILSLPVLACLISLTACGEHPAPLGPPPRPPAELTSPLPQEPPVPATDDDLAVARYIVGLRDFACNARARYNGLVAFTLGAERPDPNIGRCDPSKAPPPAPH